MLYLNKSRKMKEKFRAPFYIVTILAVALLIYNFKILNEQKLEKQLNAEMVDHFFDMQEEYEKTMDELIILDEKIQTLEGTIDLMLDENRILKTCCGEVAE
tara:strand:+ start:273 stop:575 length:303 start_codon:yes stop_codon:yes gene_type:complete